MRESVETYSTAGPLGGYEYFAKSASALIADVKATSPKPGEVDVRVLLTGGELPGEEILKEVLDILDADTVRPLTDHVTVAAPQAVPYNIDVTYYTQEGSALSADTIAADVAAAVKSFQKWQAEKMGRDVNPSQLIALLMQTGVKRVISIHASARRATGRGTHDGLYRLEEFMRSYYFTRKASTERERRAAGLPPPGPEEVRHYSDGWVLKCDISKYFYSIQHEPLKQMTRKYIKDPDILWLVDLIVDSTENPGIPIGNQTSQWFASCIFQAWTIS